LRWKVLFWMDANGGRIEGKEGKDREARTFRDLARKASALSHQKPRHPPKVHRVPFDRVRDEGG